MADTFQIPSLKTTSQDLVDSTVQLITTRLQEVAPDIDFTKQAAFTLLPYLHGLVLAGTTAELINTLKYQNLEGLLAGNVTDDQADTVVAAFGIARRPAVANTISVLFVLTGLTPFSLSTTDSVSVGGVAFAVTKSVSIRTSASSVSSSTDLVLNQIGTGKWGVVVPMTAVTPSAAGNLPAGTALTVSKSITSFLSATILATAGIGADAETSSQMAQRVLAAISVKTWASRNSFETLARSNSSMTSIVAVSALGFGDPEQQRDKRGVLPVSQGGRTDVWVKFRPGLYSAIQPVTAALTAKTGSIGTWGFTLNGQDFPGLYRVAYIVAQDDQSGASFVPDSEVLQLGVPAVMVIPKSSSDQYVPDVRSSQEAAYSSYVNDVVLFTDTRYDVTSKSVGFTRSYNVFVYYEPLTNVLQQQLGTLTTSNPAGDVLVKTAIPCEVSVTLIVTAHTGKTLPSANSIQQAVAAFINATGFIKAISYSDISSAASTVIGQNGTIAINSLTGKLKRITGDYMTVAPDSSGSLAVPDMPQESLTYRTVGFYSDVTKISVVIQ